MMKKIISSIILFCLLGSTFQAKAQPDFIKDSLINYINQGIKDWQIPGLSIVIVKDGKIVLMKGFGVKDITNNEPVDENTLFMIASNTKLFTGTALAQLEYHKKLSLNDKIGKYITGYELFDSTSTKLVTIKDMMSHRIGTKTFQGDFTFFDGNLSRREIMFGMRYLKPVGNFRQDFGYCNSCFLTAGEVIPVVTGKPWEVYVYDSIISPLKMKNTHVLGSGIERMQNVSKAYTTSFTGKLNKVPYDTWDNLGPAASIISNVNDLSHWLMMQLDSGNYNQQKIMPWNVIQKTRDINITYNSRKSSFYPIHFQGYGLGVFVGDYNGRQLYWHTGGASGMVSNVCFVPEENLGIAILTNNDNQNFFEALRYQILDAYLGVPYVNRSTQQLSNFEKGETQALKEIEALKSRMKNNATPLAITEYTGEYTNQLYGKIIITSNGNQLNVSFKSHNNLTATIDYLDNNEWLLQYNNILYGIFQLKFKIENKKVKSVNIKVNDFIEYDPYTFIKK
jgi:CubicO group peptidase (beta-lactamase class C family)